ncbi:hypothetical protein PoB_002553100 [Plakobranchus ocellatus]|uniref:Uncharacterized protein n=1 Tax=Plakobranchus ocellatus TaxID=259542 RepID=A0AAV3ZWV2_9GAST|nr:hypothetical protein PoB_002553100 [Plakobranchus ocellatus]
MTIWSPCRLVSLTPAMMDSPVQSRPATASRSFYYYWTQRDESHQCVSSAYSRPVFSLHQGRQSKKVNTEPRGDNKPGERERETMRKHSTVTRLGCNYAYIASTQYGDLGLSCLRQARAWGGGLEHVTGMSLKIPGGFSNLCATNVVV